jgi:hypothetical protein
MELALMYTLEQGQTKTCEAAERGVFVGRDTYLEFLRPISAPEGETCVICQHNFLDHPQDVVQTLQSSCQHAFHRDCLTAWMTGGHNRRDSCPVYRTGSATVHRRRGIQCRGAGRIGERGR